MTAVALITTGAAVQTPDAAAAADFAVGISDSDDDTFTHPAWAGLNVTRARAVVPWDIASRQDERRAEFDRWLANARAQGVEPFVTMGPSDQVTHSGTCSMRAPTRDEFAQAFDAVRATFGVTVISVWNEPNFAKECAPGNPRVVTPSGRAFHDATCPASPSTDNCGPLAAAFYWRLATAACPDCILPAGEFDSTPDDAYWDQYQVFLRDHRPKLWSIHPYTDGNRFQATGDSSAPATTSFVNQLGGTWATAGDGTTSHIWLTEVGAYWRDAEEQVFGDDSHRDTTAFILRLPELSDRITRLYYFNFQNNTDTGCPKQDRGLVATASGCGDSADRVRPAYHKIANRDSSPGPSMEPAPQPSAGPSPQPSAGPSPQPSPEPSPEPSRQPAATDRVAGPDRIGTAVAISQRAFPGGAGTLHLAREDVFADALTAGTLHGPVLLVPSCGRIPDEVATEVRRLAAGNVVALGGTDAVCDATLDALAGEAATGRWAGATRVATSVAVSRQAYPEGAGTVYLANAADAPDAVAGGALTGGPILLVPGTGSADPVVRDEVERLGATSVVALGGSAAVGDDVVADVAGDRETGRIAGPDRSATSAAIAGVAFPDTAATVYLARGDVFADAVAAGSLADGPVLLVPNCGTLPETVRAAIDRLGPSMVVALGGPAAVCDELLAQAAG